MNKLKLDLDALTVESFDTRTEASAQGGTVQAHQQSELGTCHDTCGESRYDTCYETCAMTCDPLRLTCGKGCIWTE